MIRDFYIPESGFYNDVGIAAFVVLVVLGLLGLGAVFIKKGAIIVIAGIAVLPAAVLVYSSLRIQSDEMIYLWEARIVEASNERVNGRLAAKSDWTRVATDLPSFFASDGASMDIFSSARESRRYFSGKDFFLIVSAGPDGDFDFRMDSLEPTRDYTEEELRTLLPLFDFTAGLESDGDIVYIVNREEPPAQSKPRKVVKPGDPPMMDLKKIQIDGEEVLALVVHEDVPPNPNMILENGRFLNPNLVPDRKPGFRGLF